MSIIDSATNLVTSTSQAISNIGPASGLSSITNAVNGITNSFSSIFKKLPGVKLPLPNPLFNYASYDYVVSIGCLTERELNNPEETYRNGASFPLICKSANSDPNNRVQSSYGKFDFFVDDIEIKSLIGFEEGQNTNVFKLKFKVTEPYSMGLFMISCQQLAQNQGHDNWREAPFILSIDFRGNTETGQIHKIANTSRYIPFTFTKISMKANDQGSIYSCEAIPYNQQALQDAYTKFKTDVAAKGSTVQEVLQTGSKSVQAAANKFYQDQVTKGIITKPDEIVILFPDNSYTPKDSTNSAESTTSATAAPNDSSNQSLFSKLGLVRSTLNATLVQQSTACNALGRSSMGYDTNSKRGDVSVGKDNVVYDPALKVDVRANNSINIKQGELKFSQETDILNAINQTLLNSDFIEETFDTSKLSPEGYRGWWRIDVQTYSLDSTVDPKTGSKPKLIVYRVVPYDVHASNLMPPNTKAPGFSALDQQAVKEYNYIYTGKNVDVLDFDIEIRLGFTGIMAADGLTRSQDAVTADKTGNSQEKQVTISPLGDGNLPEKKLGVIPTIVKFIGTMTGTDKLGGGGSETTATRAGRLFYDAVTSGMDMIKLNMKIVGDPYFIAQSGTGNYTAQPTEYANLNADGSVNYQSGEVDVRVNFRTPVDINQNTGLYDFGTGRSSPAIQYSGLYQIITVTSNFKQGQFTQQLVGRRRPFQEATAEATPEQTFSPKKTAPNTTASYSGDN